VSRSLRAVTNPAGVTNAPGAGAAGTATRTVRIGVLGCGNVGGSFVELVRAQQASVEQRTGLRLEITRSVAAVFCARAKEIVAAGRPSCRWCGRPIDPDGHPCPRMN